jgi:hypothetical protein
MPDLIRHPVPSWIPAFAGMTTVRYLAAGVIIKMMTRAAPIYRDLRQAAGTQKISIGSLMWNHLNRKSESIPRSLLRG